MTSSAEKQEERPAVEDLDTTDVESNHQDTQVPEDEPNYPKGLALAAIMGAVWLALFLVALVSAQHGNLAIVRANFRSRIERF